MKDISPMTRLIAADDAMDRADVALVAAIAAIDSLLPPCPQKTVALQHARLASTKISLARSALAEMGDAPSYSARPRI